MYVYIFFFYMYSIQLIIFILLQKQLQWCKVWHMIIRHSVPRRVLIGPTNCQEPVILFLAKSGGVQVFLLLTSFKHIFALLTLNSNNNNKTKNTTVKNILGRDSSSPSSPLWTSSATGRWCTSSPGGTSCTSSAGGPSCTSSPGGTSCTSCHCSGGGWILLLTEPSSN